MSSTGYGGLGSPRHGAGRRGRALASWSKRSIALALAVGVCGAFATNALADGTKTLPGGPLIVSVGSLGECQSSYANAGVNFYPSATLGDCGFFLAFPSAGKGQPGVLQNEVYGFEGLSGPHVPSEGGGEYTAISQGEPTGTGTAADPYTEVTTFKVRASSNSKDYALITVTTTYVAGQAQFTSTYDVQNITGMVPGNGFEPATATTLYFHAILAGDLYVNNDDRGSGVFLAGPPKFIGGRNDTSGVLGGFIEAPGALPWTNYQEGYWNGPSVPENAISQNNGIWNAVRTSANAPAVFNESIDPTEMDNGAGVSWDQYLKAGLPSAQHAVFSIINRAQVPTTLNVQPVSQTLGVGATATVRVTALDTAGNPYPNRSLVYSIGGSNPRSATATTDGSGVATISYIGTNPGLDTIQMFLDLAGNGVQAPQDPGSSAQVIWAPTPKSEYTVQNIKGNSDGTITITFVPLQSGEATLSVTVPTGTIARKRALAAIAKKHKAKKCSKTQTRIKGKCRPKVTLTGTIKAHGSAGVLLSLTVKPSSKVKAALKKGKTVHLTATLTYASAQGGTATVHTYKVTVKGKKKHKGHKKH